jgi:sRNA-binding protein
LTKALGITREEAEGVSTLKQLAEESQRALAWVALERDNLRVECGRLREEMEARVSQKLMHARAELKRARADMAQATRMADIAKEEKGIANPTRESEYRTRVCVEAERDVLRQQVLDLPGEIGRLEEIRGRAEPGSAATRFGN